MFFQYSWYSLTDWIRLNTSTETNQNSQASILIGGQQLSSQCANFLQGPCHLFIAFCSNFNQSFTVPNPFQLSCRLNTRKSQISSKQGLISSPLCSQKKTPPKPPVQIATPPFFTDPSEISLQAFWQTFRPQGTKKATVNFPSHPLRMSFVKTGCLKTVWPAARWWFWSLKMEDEITLCVTVFPTTWVHRKWWFCFRYLIRFTETNLQNKEQHSKAGFFPHCPFLHQRYTSLPSTMNAASPKATWEKSWKIWVSYGPRKWWRFKHLLCIMYAKPCQNL